ncbi:hypothetical protein [Soonwooa sp.]|uniref:hypothetical protein n=1 Tax=Soonwooa sp. TaxID=1938592 RepID=UPI0026250803|nr:hypothetical protein [Soonwooa sp.]
MKHLFLSLGFFTLLNCNTSKNKMAENADHDGRLIGKWSMAFDNASITRSRTITREADGKFVADNATRIQGRAQHYQTSGTWWTDNGFYYEANIQSGDTIKYKYKVDNVSKLSFEKEPSTEEDFKYFEVRQ